MRVTAKTEPRLRLTHLPSPLHPSHKRPTSGNLQDGNKPSPSRPNTNHNKVVKASLSLESFLREDT